MQIKMIQIGLCFVLLLNSKASSLSANPGINIRVTQKGIDYASSKVIDDWYKNARGKPIEEIEGESSGASYKFSNVQITSISKPEFNVQVDRNEGLTTALKITSATITTDLWVKYKKWFVSITKTGTAEAKISDLLLLVPVSLKADKYGRPVVSVRSPGCEGSIGSFTVDINITGFVGWMVNRFEGLISKKIKGKIVPELCATVENLIATKVNQELQSMKVETTVQDPRLTLDYSLLRNPTFGPGFIDLTIKAQASWQGRTLGIPSIARDWPDIPDAGERMAVVYVPEDIVNSVGLLLYNNNVLRRNVTREDVPEEERGLIDLKCSVSPICAAYLLPELAEKYPDGWVEASIWSTDPPSVDITDKVIADLHGGVALYVKRKNGQSIFVGEFQMSLQLSINVTFVDNFIKGQAELTNMKLSKSDFLDTQSLTLVSNLAVNGFLITELNKLGEKGIELPSFANVKVVDPEIDYLEGTVVILTDLAYTGTVFN